MTPHKTGSTTTPGDSLATAPPTRTFGLQGPTLGALIDAYLQDYQVRQFRSVSTARGRVAHLTAFFGRAADLPPLNRSRSRVRISGGRRRQDAHEAIQHGTDCQ